MFFSPAKKLVLMADCLGSFGNEDSTIEMKCGLHHVRTATDLELDRFAIKGKMHCHFFTKAFTLSRVLVVSNARLLDLHLREKPNRTCKAFATMVKAITVHQLGGPEVLKWEEVDVGEPSEGEIRVKHKAIGVNFIDVYFRKGVYKAEKLPFIPGREAVGVVTAVGPGLTGVKEGDLVAYAGNPMGSYTEEQLLPANVVVPVPLGIDPVLAAAVLLKGMTAWALLRRCFKVEPGHTILVHAAAGGVGSLLCQWGSALGATVIGTVSTKEKAAQATEDGCHHPILYNEENFVDRVKEITKGQGVQVVYDSVGKDTFQGSLECLALRGYMVSFGQSSGIPDPVPLSSLAAKSLFLTRPTMMRYGTPRDELLAAASEVFGKVASGVLKVRVNHIYPLSEAAKAHADLEARKTSGSIVLIPDAN